MNPRLARLFPDLLLAVLLALGLSACRSTPPPSEPPPVLAEAQFHVRAAMVADTRRQWPNAATNWSMAADRFALLNRQADQATALHHLALALLQLQRPEDARTHLIEAARINQSLNLEDFWWRNQIALLKLEMAQTNTAAITALLESLGERVKHYDSPLARGALANERGRWHLTQGQLGLAEADFRDALEAFRQARDKPGTATATLNLARTLERSGQLAPAQELWADGLAQFEALGHPGGIAAGMAGLGRILLARNLDLAKAEDLLRRAAANFQRLGDTQAQQNAEQALEEALRTQGKATKPKPPEP